MYPTMPATVIAERIGGFLEKDRSLGAVNQD